MRVMTAYIAEIEFIESHDCLHGENKVNEICDFLYGEKTLINKAFTEIFPLSIIIKCFNF